MHAQALLYSAPLRDFLLRLAEAELVDWIAFIVKKA